MDLSKNQFIKDNNTIGDMGCQSLIQTQLKILLIAMNQIGSEGIRYFTRINWLLLQKVYLSMI